MTTRAIHSRKIKALKEPLALVSKTLLDNVPQFEISGSTQNLYYVNFIDNWMCTCPDFANRQYPACKHIYFLWYRVFLPAHEEISSSSVSETLLEVEYPYFTNLEFIKSYVTQNINVRRDAHARILPTTDMCCPICLEDFNDITEQHTGTITYCGTCGNPVHARCFVRWCATSKSQLCVYCRGSINP